MRCEPGNTPFFRVTAFALLLAGATLFALPFFWMLSTSLKPLNETMAIPPVWWPSHLLWRNYPETIATMGHFWLFVWNTVYVCLLSVTGCVLSSALVAYGFSRIDWPGRDKVFLLVLAGMMMPFAVTISNLMRQLPNGSRNCQLRRLAERGMSKIGDTPPHQLANCLYVCAIAQAAEPCGVL